MEGNTCSRAIMISTFWGPSRWPADKLALRDRQGSGGRVEEAARRGRCDEAASVWPALRQEAAAALDEIRVFVNADP